MSSEYAVKKANHREVMEELSRQQQSEVRKTKSKHRNEMEQIRNKQELDKTQLRQSNHNQLEKLEQQQDTFVKKSKLTHQDRLNRQKLQAQQDYERAALKRQAENARHKQQKDLEKLKFFQTKEQYRNLSSVEKHKGEKRLSDMQKEAQFRVRQKRAQNAELQNNVQQHHNKEMSRMQKLNHSKLHEQKTHFAKKEDHQQKAHRHNLEKNQDHFNTMRKRQHKHYHTKLDKDEEFFQEEIKSQRQEYKKRFNENERQHEIQYANQENRLEEELFKIRKDFISNAEFYEQRKQDPFYQLVDFDASFNEGESFYELKAQIPEHEMKNVKVHVQPDKVTLQAARTHEQEFEARNEKIATNNSQTIRQEFVMDKPADHEKIVKSYKDGMLVVTIPKQGFHQFGIKS